jgi:hypothetical protein
MFFTKTVELRATVEVECIGLDDARATAMAIAKEQGGEAAYDLDWFLQKPSPIRVVKVEEISSPTHPSNQTS